MAYAFKRSGCRGVVMDGLIRDAEDITSHELPVYCRGVTPVNGARRWGLVEVGGSIRLPGAGGVAVTVVPGDYVVGDADGVVVIPAAVAGSIIADAEKLAQVEQRIAEELQAGGERSDVFRRNPRFSHIRTVA